MKIDTYISFIGLDKDGNEISHREEKAHSLVRGFIASLYNLAFNASVASVPDITNTSRTLSTNQPYWTNSGGAAAGVYDIGIVAGTGTTAVTVTDYKLETTIVHGTGSGQLSYAAELLDTAWTTSGSTSYFTRSRVLTNSSGADITINEVGYIGCITSSGYKILVERTIPTPYVVANSSGVKIVYKWQVSV